MTTLGRFDLLQAEQDAFEQQLDAMIASHGGEFVLFRERKPVAFFDSYDAAYEEGLKRFGLDQVFLVSEVKRRSDEPVSISWDTGVMFGQQ